MSLINDMLRNLEERHAANAPLPNEVRPLPRERNGLPVKSIVAAVAVIAVAAVGGFLALRDSGTVARPTAPAPVQLAPVTPAMPQSVPPVVVAAVPAPIVSVVPAPPEPPAPTAIVPVPAVPAVSLPVAELAKPAATEKQSKLQTLRLATELLPSWDRPKNSASTASATTPAPPVEKASADADPAVQAEADLRRARALLGQGARAEAEQAFKQGLAKLPTQTTAAMTLARLQIDRNDAAAAWETLQNSLPHAREQAAYRAFCGTVLQRLNRAREAIEHYQVALRLNPAEGRWWVGLGLSLEGAGQAAEAREAFQRARAAGNLPPEMASFVEQKTR